MALVVRRNYAQGTSGLRRSYGVTQMYLWLRSVSAEWLATAYCSVATAAVRVHYGTRRLPS